MTSFRSSPSASNFPPAKPEADAHSKSTKKFTYYPLPQVWPLAGVPEVEVEANNTVGLGSRFTEHIVAIHFLSPRIPARGATSTIASKMEIAEGRLWPPFRDRTSRVGRYDYAWSGQQRAAPPACGSI